MAESFAETSIKLAQKSGATEALARLTLGANYQVRFSHSSIDISQKWDESRLEILLAIGRKVTDLEIEDPTAKKIEDAIQRALRFLKKMPDSEFYGGFDKQKYTYQPLKGIYDQKIVDFFEKAPEYVNAAINSSLKEGAKRVAGVLYFGKGTIEQMTSYGNKGSYDYSYYRMTIRSFVDNESSGQDIAVGKNFDNIEKKLTTAGMESGKLAKMAIGGKQGKAGTYDFLMNPTVGGNIMGQVTDSANPLLIFLGMSPLKDRFGEQIAPENLSIVDNSKIHDGLGSRPFDLEGTPTGTTPIINKGVLVGLVHNSTSAALMKAKSTGNSDFVNFSEGSKILAPVPSNTVYTPGNQTLDEIIAECKKPTIYVTSNWYTRYTNMLEGEFSSIPRDGIFLIENGEIKKPIRKIRISDNLLRMYKNISAIGKDLKQIFWWEVGTPTFIPYIKVADCRITAATK